MPVPTDEQVRKAVEESIQAGVATDATWLATLENGSEIEFRPQDDGTIEISKWWDTDADEVEKTYKFRIRVEPIAE